MEELGLQYQLERFARESNMLAPAALMAVIHPLGKAPTIRDGDTVLVEIGAILITSSIAMLMDGSRYRSTSPEYARYVPVDALR